MQKRHPYSSIRKPLPSPPQQPDPPMFIDQQIQHFLQKQWPGKLKKLLRQRISKKVNTEPCMDMLQGNEKNCQIFQRTFYRERLKSSERSQRMEGMRKRICGLLATKDEPVDCFYQYTRKNILSIERQSLLQFPTSTKRYRTRPQHQNFSHSQNHNYSQIKAQPRKQEQNLSQNSSQIESQTESHSQSQYRKSSVHPIIKLSQKTIKRVQTKIISRPKTQNFKPIKFRPFGKFEPIQL